ncbi:MAG: FeoC-like transcriptional regulator [Gammaproteobacteria bacterium]|nr:FeoC-like transcriptional regulator [Gammaproteobacteria bacterium]
MILADIKRYLIHHHQATLNDIALHCDADPDAVRGMLEHWIRKGRVERRVPSDACSSGCSKCDPSDLEYYVWLDGSGNQAAMEVPLGQDCPTR